MTFTLQAYDLLPADQAAKFPEILTFKGHNPAAPVETGRFDLGPLGFHAMFTHQGKTVFVDPLRNADGYAVYYQQDAYSRLEEEGTRLSAAKPAGRWRTRCRWMATCASVTLSPSRRRGVHPVYGGSKALATAAIATLLGRVNEVYQRDVGPSFSWPAATMPLFSSIRQRTLSTMVITPTM